MSRSILATKTIENKITTTIIVGSRNKGYKYTHSFGSRIRDNIKIKKLE